MAHWVVQGKRVIMSEVWKWMGGEGGGKMVQVSSSLSKCSYTTTLSASSSA